MTAYATAQRARGVKRSFTPSAEIGLGDSRCSEMSTITAAEIVARDTRYACAVTVTGP
jgi:hypothetical protein